MRSRNLADGHWTSLANHNAASGDAILEIENLSVGFGDGSKAVDGVSFSVGYGEKVALVGESGSGKSVTALSVTRLIESLGGSIGVESSIRFKGNEVLQESGRGIRALRAKHVGMVFQDPLSALNPVYTIGDQIAESVRIAEPGLSKADQKSKAIEYLRRVGIASPDRKFGAYPHEFSGGMRQRVMIAMALAGGPELIIADEPTTALDVTIQAQIIALLDELVESEGLSILLITHDLGLVAGFADRIHVMYGGRIVETATTSALYEQPTHPYTLDLLRCVPRLDSEFGQRLVGIPGDPPRPSDRPTGCVYNPRCAHADPSICTTSSPGLTIISPEQTARCHFAGTLLLNNDLSEETILYESRINASAGGDAPAVLRVTDLHKHFWRGGGSARGQAIRALDGVTFDLFQGETLGLVGESGSGKSTLARALTFLAPPTSGDVEFRGKSLAGLSSRELRGMRREIQMVFQDPRASMDPRMKVGEILAEPLKIHGLWNQPGWNRKYVADLLELVSLSPSDVERYPHEFSGGQRQRIAIARALALQPKVVVLDEPVSSLDVSTQAEVVSLLKDIQAEREISYIFVAHDLAVVRNMSDRIAVMYCGQIVEIGAADQVCAEPQHPYTQALISAVPYPDPVSEARRESILLSGAVPDPENPPPGCRFHTRCRYMIPGVCDVQDVKLNMTAADSAVACHLHHIGPVLSGKSVNTLPASS